ncbi:MAG: hypothetical protein P1P84_02150 [Deferrisomatales bacterium]|nr:hypothetical protein [Deferrisomatales bacterium]
MSSRTRRVFRYSTIPPVLAGVPAWAGSLDRLKGVSDHARQRVAGGPEHLWVGVAIFAALAVVVGCAAWWALGRKKG